MRKMEVCGLPELQAFGWTTIVDDEAPEAVVIVFSRSDILLLS